MPGDGGLRDCRYTEAFRGEQQRRDVRAAVDRAVCAEQPVAGDDRGVRRAEQVEVERHLYVACVVVVASDAERVVETKTGAAAAFLVDAGVFLRPGNVVGVGRGIRGILPQSHTKLVRRLSAGYDDLPGLRVAPRGCTLRNREHLAHIGLGHRLVGERAAGVAIIQKAGESLDLEGSVCHWAGGLLARQNATNLP